MLQLRALQLVREVDISARALTGQLTRSLLAYERVRVELDLKSIAERDARKLGWLQCRHRVPVHDHAIGRRDAHRCYCFARPDDIGVGIAQGPAPDDGDGAVWLSCC
jgi:hypothetical protein